MSTITFYPIADVSVSLAQSPSSGSHYDKLQTDDGYITMIYDADNTSYVYDTFRIGSFALGTINSVTIYARCDGDNERAWTKFGFVKYGTNYFGSEHTNSGWVTFSDTWTTDPSTGLAWTIDGLAKMDILIGCRLYNTSWHWYCTKFWVVIDYTPFGESYEVLYPTSDGTYQELASGSYADVDDPIDSPDWDSTYVANNRETYYRIDTYGLQDLSSPYYLQINAVVILYRVKSVNTVGCWAKPALYTNSTISYGTEISTGSSDTLRAEIFTTNPVTGNPWTKAEIQDLQIGIAVKSKSGGWIMRCTQILAVVSYTVGNAPCASPQIVGLTAL